MKIDLLEKYTFEEDIDHKIGFTRSQPQGFEIAQQSTEANQPDFKIWTRIRYGTNLDQSNSQSPSGGKSSLKSVMFCGAEEAILGDGKEAPFWKLIRFYEG